MVTSSRLPVLWLCGAPATGKSTVAWQVFNNLADQGLCVGYLDIDQRGMLQPPPDADPSCFHTPGTQELPECSAGDVTLVIGPRAVGKSSVSWGMAMRRWISGERTAYVDLDQVGFLRPAPSDASLQAANLGLIWRNALTRGAHRLIANGPGHYP